VRNRIICPVAPNARGTVSIGTEPSSRSEERRYGVQETSVWVPADHYSSHGGAPLRIYRDAEEISFLSRIQSCPLRFRDVAWTYSGLIARHGQQSVQARQPQESFLLRDPSGRDLFADPAAGERWRPALLSGSEILAYRVVWGGGHVYWPAERLDVPKVYKSGYDIGRYEKPKVFLRQTGDRLTAAVDRRGLLCLNNLHLMGSSENAGISPLVLAGVLMSAPVQRTYRIISLESARPLAQVDLKMVEGLPYPADSAGSPIGSGAMPARTSPPVRKLLRALERALTHDDSAALLELAELAWSQAGRPMAEGPLTGRETLHLMLEWLLEKLEYAVENSPPRAVRRQRVTDYKPRTPRTPRGAAREDVELFRSLLDGIVSICFQVAVPPTD
jgi:hypothetical protein